MRDGGSADEAERVPGGGLATVGGVLDESGRSPDRPADETSAAGLALGDARPDEPGQHPDRFDVKTSSARRSLGSSEDAKGQAAGSEGDPSSRGSKSSALHAKPGIDRYVSADVSKHEWPRRFTPLLPEAAKRVDLAAPGLVVLVSRDDPTAWAAQLASRSDIRKWLVAPHHHVEVDIATKSPGELADAWLRTAHQSGDRVLLCRSVAMLTVFERERLGDQATLEEIARRLVAGGLTVVLPVHMMGLNRLSFWQEEFGAGPGLSVAVLPWAQLFVRRRAKDKGDLPDMGLVEAISALPGYLESTQAETCTAPAMDADAKLYAALAATADTAESWPEISAALRKKIDEFRSLSLTAFLASQDEEAVRSKEDIIRSISDILLPQNGGARDEIAAAMLLVTAFCGALPPVTFRNVVRAILPPGPVLSPAQLSPELREAWEREDNANAALKRDRAPLPSWDEVIATRAYDKAMSDARLVADGAHVRLSSGYGRIDLQGEIGSRYTSLIDSALAAVAQRDAILDPGNLHYLPLVELFSRIEARLPGRVDRAVLIEALTTCPGDRKLELIQQDLLRASAAAAAAEDGMDPDDVAALAAQYARDLREGEDRRRTTLDDMVASRLGPIIAKLFQLFPPSSDRDGFADQIVEELAHRWATERATVLMYGLIRAMFENPDMSVERAWRLLRLLFQRLRQASSSERSRGPGTADVIDDLQKLFRESSAEDASSVRIWLAACRERCDDDPYWDNVQILAHECMAEVGIRWMSRPFNGRRRDFLAHVILGENGERPGLERAIKGFVDRFFGDPALERVRALELLMRVRHGSTGDAVTPRLRDVFWVLMDGARSQDVNAARRLDQVLFGRFVTELRLDGFPMTHSIDDLGAEIARQALPRNANAASAQKAEAATRLSELFRAAVLAHWRFEMAGTTPLRRDDPVTDRFRDLLRLVADARPDRGFGLGKALETLARLQTAFRVVVKSYGEASLAELFEDKAYVINELSGHVLKRSAQRKV